jgi:hypothetical protein
LEAFFDAYHLVKTCMVYADTYHLGCLCVPIWANGSLGEAIVDFGEDVLDQR